jgi:hypothetical protein
MYNNPSAPLAAGGATGVLAYTGFDAIWLALAAFAMIALGAALMRIVPKPVTTARTPINARHWAPARRRRRED